MLGNLETWLDRLGSECTKLLKEVRLMHGTVATPRAAKQVATRQRRIFRDQGLDVRHEVLFVCEDAWSPEAKWTSLPVLTDRAVRRYRVWDETKMWN